MLKDILSPPIYGIWNYFNLYGFVTLIEAISPQFRHTVQISGDPVEKKLPTGCKVALPASLPSPIESPQQDLQVNLSFSTKTSLYVIYVNCNIKKIWSITEQY